MSCDDFRKSPLDGNFQFLLQFQTLAACVDRTTARRSDRDPLVAVTRASQGVDPMLFTQNAAYSAVVEHTVQLDENVCQHLLSILPVFTT